jgi:hypothetical protein
MHRTQKGIPECYSTEHICGKKKGTFHYAKSPALVLVYSIYNFWSFWLCDSSKHMSGCKTGFLLNILQYPQQTLSLSANKMWLTRWATGWSALLKFLHSSAIVGHISFRKSRSFHHLPLLMCMTTPLYLTTDNKSQGGKIVDGWCPWQAKKNILNYSEHFFMHFIWVQDLYHSWTTKHSSKHRFQSAFNSQWRLRISLLHNVLTDPGGHPTFLIIGQHDLLWLGCESDHSPPSNVEVENAWSYSLIPLYPDGVVLN